MSAELSDFAIRRILKVLDANSSYRFGPRAEAAGALNQRWSVIFRLYFVTKPAPSLDYLSSAEFTLALKNYDANAIFAHGKPLIFKECPRLLGTKIVEGFRRLQDEPLFVDVTAVVACPWPGVRPTDVWPEVYDGYLPCYSCTTANLLVAEEPRRLRRTGESSDSDDGKVTSVVEKFHIRSGNYGRLLTVEFHLRLFDGWSETDRLTIADAASDEKKSGLEKVVFRLEDLLCRAQRGLGVKQAEARSPTAIVRLPELVSDVYFLDRVHAGTSLVANRSLYEIICSLAHRLPVHHLICELERDTYQGGCRRFWTGLYWFTLTHLQRDLPYDDERLFKMPSSTAAADSALICRYLSNSHVPYDDERLFKMPSSTAAADTALICRYRSNSHVARLRMPGDSVLYLCSRNETDETLRDEYRFAIRMLADVATRNFSVGYLRLYAGDDPLTNYRSMDIILGGMRIEVLDLWPSEDRFANLIKTTDFFHLRTIHGLRELRLKLWMKSDSQEPLPDLDCRDHSVVRMLLLRS